MLRLERNLVHLRVAVKDRLPLQAELVNERRATSVGIRPAMLQAPSRACRSASLHRAAAMARASSPSWPAVSARPSRSTCPAGAYPRR